MLFWIYKKRKKGLLIDKFELFGTFILLVSWIHFMNAVQIEIEESWIA